MGLEEHVEDVWTLFAAVATHKFVISFCMGIELVSAGTPLPFFLTYIITFAVMTPLGIGIGLAVTELAADSDHIGYVAATGTLQGDVIQLSTLQGPLLRTVQVSNRLINKVKFELYCTFEYLSTSRCVCSSRGRNHNLRGGI